MYHYDNELMLLPRNGWNSISITYNSFITFIFTFIFCNPQIVVSSFDISLSVHLFAWKKIILMSVTNTNYYQIYGKQNCYENYTGMLEITANSSTDFNNNKNSIQHLQLLHELVCWAMSYYLL